MRSFFFFLFWFLWIGGSNVIPQVYLLSRAPAHKEALLALLLVLGSLVSVAGILLANRLPRLLRRLGGMAPAAVPVMFTLCLAAFIGLFFDPPPVVYLLGYLVFRFVSCLLYQYLDLTLVHGSNPPEVSRHNRDAMLFMFLAITVSPLFFAYVDSIAWVAAVVVALALIALHRLGGLVPLQDTPGGVTAGPGAFAGNGSERPFIVYAGAYLAVIYLTSSLLVYFIRDYYGLPEPVQKAGWVMLITSGSAVLSCLAYARLRDNIGRDVSNWWIQGAIVGFQAIAILLLFLKPFESVYFLCVCTSLMGVAHGMFMVLTRQYAGELEARHRNGILALYNLLPYGSTILVFAAVGGLKLAAVQLGGDFYLSLAGLLALLLSIVVMALPWLAARERINGSAITVPASS